MLDTHTIARSLIAAGVDPDHADAIMDTVRQAAARGDHVTSERLDVVIANLRADIYRAMTMQTAVTVGLLGVILAALRWLD